MISTSWTSVALLLFASSSLAAFNPSGNNNVVAYWGQNSYGATHPDDTANFQQNLSAYCSDTSVDVFPLAFLDVFFDIDGLPSVNFANICNDVDDSLFPGSDLPDCQFMASDIQACQAAGKIVTLSMGGATGAATFSSDSQAEAFADLIWDLFLGGTSDTRPFGDAVLDGLDLDIEGGGSTGFAAFVTQIRSHTDGASKPYYITAAPQCPFPDAFLGPVINAVGFDAVYVQFYNNFCELSNFGVSGDFDFSTWDNWAKTTSPNRNVKVYLGAPASPTAAGSGYVDPATLATIIKSTQSQFSSFGGVMLWDISQAVANDHYEQSAKSALLGESRVATSAPAASSASAKSQSSVAPSVAPSAASSAASSVEVSTVSASSASVKAVTSAISSSIQVQPSTGVSNATKVISPSASVLAPKPSSTSNATTDAQAHNTTDSSKVRRSRFFKF
ncbi:glycoside hydrolase family 18 protein [Collybiopsis luxurians FD-317 M1]|uniref:chitinase n=1 Tax=Collybiopsis luxurians FD-317 M1 TaxID=944289 RepID=A0A0D0BEZ6_9AGAR|nr:glycoside hydrolase family 18 protein [Collybiopsis luxurians FD-317 M1]